MAKGKGSLINPKFEPKTVKTQTKDSPNTEERELPNETLDLKRRMDKADQEMRAMTEAIKSTMMDVRVLMQDMDNPFNMLRDMGVDKLVNKTAEKLEDEVDKQKREAPGKPITEENKTIDSLTNLSGSFESPHATIVGTLPSQPTFSHSHSSTRYSTEPSIEASHNGSSPSTGYGVLTSPKDNAKVQSSGTINEGSLSQIQENVQLLMKKVALTEQTMHTILHMVSRTEEAVDELNKVAKELIDNLNGGRPGNRGDSPKNQEGLLLKPEVDEEKKSKVYYEAYVSLVADYLVLRFGEKGADELLLEGMYKEWSSPRVVKDILDHIHSGYKAKKKRSIHLPPGIGQMNNELEDKILLTSLLKNLDKPVSEWTEPTHLFLLLALVTRARECKATRVDP